MDIFKSKKFYMAVVGILAMLAANWLPVTEDQIMGIAGVIMAYIFGQGIADNGKSAALIAGK